MGPRPWSAPNPQRDPKILWCPRKTPLPWDFRLSEWPQTLGCFQSLQGTICSGTARSLEEPQHLGMPMTPRGTPLLCSRSSGELKSLGYPRSFREHGQGHGWRGFSPVCPAPSGPFLVHSGQSLHPRDHWGSSSTLTSPQSTPKEPLISRPNPLRGLSPSKGAGVCWSPPCCSCVRMGEGG